MDPSLNRVCPGYVNKNRGNMLNVKMLTQSIGRSPLDKLLIFLVIAFLFLIFYMGFVGFDFNESSGTKLTTQKKIPHGNGIVTNIWIYPESRLDTLKENNIKYLFVDIGETKQNGEIASSTLEIRSFLKLIKDYEKENNYDFILLPYSEINTYNYDISLQNFRENFIKSYMGLLQLGFDGILIDIEPARFEQRAIYIEFLKDIQNTFPEDSIISLYSGSISNPPESESNNEWEWSIDFFSQVSRYVDLISVPSYDTDIKNKEDYDKYIRMQTNQLLKNQFNSYFTFATPTHKQAPETIENALAIYNSEIGNRIDTNFIGVTIFSEWTIDEFEWNSFKDFRNYAIS